MGDHNSALDFWRQAAEADPTGYYSERASDLLAGKQPFEPPDMLDLGYDGTAERRQAEEWLRQTFDLPSETNLSGPGALTSDLRFLRGREFWQLGLYSKAMVEFEELRMANQKDPVASFRLAGEKPATTRLKRALCRRLEAVRGGHRVRPVNHRTYANEHHRPSSIAYRLLG